MKRRFSFLLIVLSVVLLAACSSSYAEEEQQVKEALQASDFEKVEKILSTVDEISASDVLTKAKTLFQLHEDIERQFEKGDVEEIDVLMKRLRDEDIDDWTKDYQKDVIERSDQLTVLLKELQAIDDLMEKNEDEEAMKRLEQLMNTEDKVMKQLVKQQSTLLEAKKFQLEERLNSNEEQVEVKEKKKEQPVAETKKEEKQPTTHPLNDQLAMNRINEIKQQSTLIWNNAGTSTVELREASSQETQLWDNELNYIWGQLKEHLPDSEFQSLLQDQRNWIQQKESRAQAAYNQEGTMSLLEGDSVILEETENRVYWLVDTYYK